MKKQWNLRTAGAAAVTVLWLTVTAVGWFSPAKDLSVSERRPLAQMPELTVQTLFSGSFMKDFESYGVDQFPLRDGLRQLKALFHTYVLKQKDNNGIYIADGYAAELLYPVNEQALKHNLGRLQLFYEKYLKDGDSHIYAAVIPDKSYYLAAENGYPTADYNVLFSAVAQAMPWADHVDLTGSLTAEDYYRTDIHWRQENLFAAAKTLCDALGVTAPSAENYTAQKQERPFYGVYYGQAALPMEPDEMVLLENEWLKDCTVYDHESGETTAIYNMDKADSKDFYDIFLSGARSLLTVENPNAKTDRELVVVRDSFASSMVPLLLEDYARVTLVDIRYLSTEFLGSFVDFHGQDVLFLYSTKVLNTEGILR